MLEAAMEFSRRMVEARHKAKSDVDYKKEHEDLQMMQQVGDIMLIKKTIKQIKRHGK